MFVANIRIRRAQKTASGCGPFTVPQPRPEARWASYGPTRTVWTSNTRVWSTNCQAAAVLRAPPAGAPVFRTRSHFSHLQSRNTEHKCINIAVIALFSDSATIFNVQPDSVHPGSSFLQMLIWITRRRRNKHSTPVSYPLGVWWCYHSCGYHFSPCPLLDAVSRRVMRFFNVLC